jgi:hypothetical protein
MENLKFTVTTEFMYILETQSPKVILDEEIKKGDKVWNGIYVFRTEEDAKRFIEGKCDPADYRIEKLPTLEYIPRK